MFYSSTIHRGQRCSNLVSSVVKKMCTQQTVMQPLRQNATCCSRDEPGGQNAKQNNPVTKGQMLHDSAQRKDLKQSKSEKQKVEKRTVAKG